MAVYGKYMRTPSRPVRQNRKTPKGKRPIGVADPLGPDSPSLDTIARAVDALKSGRAVRLEDGWAMLAAETLTAARLAKIARGFLVLSHARAQTLKIRLYTEGAVALRLTKAMDLAAIGAITDPARDLDTPLKGPFTAVRRSLPQAFAAAVKLAKLAGLLPVAVLYQGRPHGAEVAAHEVFAYEIQAAKALRVVARAKVPLEGAPLCEMVAFRAGEGGPDNFALLIGDPPLHAPVLTRMHSECFTGDLLGSLKCDCGQQLRGAIRAIAEAGGGVLLYLAQEGRGIGMLNKLRAYHLQDQGFDTVEANLRLGFESDERVYLVAARMLRLLGFSAVRLLTNNPDKVEGLKAAGIDVVERVRHAFPENPHNRDYLRTKAEKTGHIF